MKNIDYNALGQAIDTTWGRSSTPRTASYSVKMQLNNESVLTVKYGVIVNFATERQMIELKRQYASEADSVIAETIKRVKSIYKDLTGDSLTTKVVKESESDSLEMISLNVHSARRSAYFRRSVLVELA